MNEYKNNISIKNWAENDRPREKLILKGKNILSDAELIAILIRAGNRKETAIDLAKRILNYVHNNLIELSKLTINDLTKFNGIGQAKAVTIAAALELGKRRREAEAIKRSKITSSKDVFEIFQSNISDIQYEEFWMLCLNKANKILKKICISQGGTSATAVDPKKIFKIALDNKSSYIILCHNHPSGNIQPSNEDIKLTKKLKEAGNSLDLPVIDHIIIGDEKYYSFADQGII
jgi:DNA repair protein RadC